MCHQFSVYVFADIDLRGFKVEAVEFLLQPFFITLNDFEDVGVNLAVCNQWIAQAFVAVLMTASWPFCSITARLTAEIS